MSKKTTILNSLRDYSISSEQFQEEDVSSIQRRIEELFLVYKMEWHAITYSIGPTVINFEIVLDDNCRLSKIKKSKDDMEMSLSPRGARIIAPVPGKGTVAIEVPRQNPAIVGLKQILESDEFSDDSLCLPIACGIDANNKPVVADLTKLPHLLIGGATGQGKSVFLNALIVSLLYSKSPEELKFLLIDPKMVEFSQYDSVKDKYLVNIEGCEDAIITDASEAVIALNSIVKEMDSRYELLGNARCRNIADYNSKNSSKLPYIVVVVDEFADLMLIYGKEIEMSLARLAQKARAVGIHVVIATQRPSMSVITGIIKANFPARAAFKTSNSVDSKTILDCKWAEKCLGRGDMLFYDGCIKRVQCPMVDSDEIESLCESLKKEKSIMETGLYILAAADIPEPIQTKDSDIDPLFMAVAMYFIGYGVASCSMLQKEFGIGYNRAHTIMGQLGEHGVIKKGDNGKPRDVLMSPQEFISKFRSGGNFEIG